MQILNLTQKYSPFEARLYDSLLAERVLALDIYILEHAHLLEVFAKGIPLRVLDVGCGGGQLALHLKEVYPHLQVIGIDLSPGQIARARKRSERKGVTVQFEVSDAQSLPFADAEFDIVLSLGAAKHWPDLLLGFSECLRVLKPGGELLVADATSDTTMQQVRNFYELLHFPRLIEAPVAKLLYRRMFRPTRSISEYQEIAEALGLPPGTVSQMPLLPIFLFCARKLKAAD